MVGGLICVARNILTVEKERSNYTQVLCEFCENSFHMLPRVLKVYFEINIIKEIKGDVKNQP